MAGRGFKPKANGPFTPARRGAIVSEKDELCRESIQWHSAVLSERLRAMRLIGTDVEGGARSVWHVRSICFRRRQYGGAIQQVDHSKCRQHSGCDPLFLGEQKPNELLDGCE